MEKIIVEKITPNLYMLRINDYEVKYFEALWSIPEGITYNSYLLLDEKNVLFDTWKHIYSEEFMETLKKIIDPRDLDYIVIHHMEPDHSGALPLVLKEAEKTIVLGHPMSKSMIESMYGLKPRFKPVRDGEKLFTGKHSLTFITTPWLHWPETIMTYIEPEKILLTCDAFGGYSIPEAIYDEDEEIVEKYLHYARKYLVNVIGRYTSFIMKNIDKLRQLSLDIRILAPAHGLIWRKDPWRIIEYYYKIAKGETVKDKVMVIYSSMYGFVEKAVKVAIETIRSKGYNPVVYRITDKSRDELSDIIGDAADASALVIGTATYEAGVFPLMKYYVEELLEKIPKGKPVLIITVYGWGGVAGRLLKDLVESKKHTVVDVIEFRGLINEEISERIRTGIDRLLSMIK